MARLTSLMVLFWEFDAVLGKCGIRVRRDFRFGIVASGFMMTKNSMDREYTPPKIEYGFSSCLVLRLGAKYLDV